MEKVDRPIDNEEQVPEESKQVIDRVTDDVSKAIEETNSDEKSIENKTEGKEIKTTTDDEVVPPTTPKQAKEQENVTNTNPTIPTIPSPSRCNGPFKEVNESENESSTNSTENKNIKKRELDNEDKQREEENADKNEEIGGQTKKIKINESTDNPITEIKEPENIIVNGIAAVEA